MRTRHANEGTPAPAKHIAALRSMIGKLGEEKTATELGIGRSTLARVLGGLGLRKVTRSVLNNRFGEGKAAS